MANPIDIGRARESVRKGISETDLAYIAGFVDGEGTITIQAVKRSNRSHSVSHRPVVSINNTNITVLEWIKMTFGVGRIHKSGSRGINRKDVFKYAITCSNAINVAKMLLPYLKVKRLNAEILVQFAETLLLDYSQYRLPASVFEIRSEHTKAIQSLNKRGVAGG